MFKEELEDLKNRYLARRATFAQFSREAVDSPLDSGRLDRDVDFTADTTSRLDAAARAGLDVPFSCKSGVCATCRAKLIDGRVRMDRNFALDAADMAAGFILTCQSHPLTDHVTISYDER